MWSRAEIGQSRADFLQLLQNCKDYDHETDESMTRLVESNCVLWYWSSKDLDLALAYRVSKDGKSAKVVVGVPSKRGKAEDCCKIMIEKGRVEMDLLGIKDFYATTLESYVEDFMEEFAEYIDRVCWEVKEIRFVNGVRRINFERSHDKKHEDVLLSGKGKNRKVPDRIKEFRDKRDKGGK